jgi:hypothetical protein
MRSRKIINLNVVKFFDGMPRVNKVEMALLMDAVNNHGGEVIEPANDDVKMMETIVSLYNKGLVKIDFEKDKLFVSELFLSTLPRD